VTDIISDSDIAGAHEENTGHAIARLFKNLDPCEIPAVLVANHAPFTWGVTPAEASQNAVILETVAKLAYFALQIHPDAAPAPRALIDKHFLRKHGSATSYGQPKDKK
jgi:L-ribulose-5-phosphate 4-epimerase